MSTNQANIADIHRTVIRALHDHWMLYAIEGVVLLVLGAIAIVVSVACVR